MDFAISQQTIESNDHEAQRSANKEAEECRILAEKEVDKEKAEAEEHGIPTEERRISAKREAGKEKAEAEERQIQAKECQLLDENQNTEAAKQLAEAEKRKLTAAIAAAQMEKEKMELEISQ